MAYRNQNYMTNNKTKEEIDKNQVNYEEITKILTIYLNVVDKNGKGLGGATITVGDLNITSLRGGNLVKNYPNTATTISVSKKGYKTISTDLILNAVRQGHTFKLELESSSQESSVTSWPKNNDTEPDSEDEELKEISISVKNDDNEPIPADIKFDNETYNTTANESGEASIKVPKDTDKFTITLSGYETKIVTIGENSSFNITLNPLGEKIQQGKQYMFESYGDENGTELWGTGTVEVTGTTINGYTEVKVLTNEPEEEFVDQTFFINSNAQYNDDSLYELYTDSGETGTGIYVKVFVWVIMTKGVDVDVGTKSTLGNKSFRLVDLYSQKNVVQGTSNNEGIFTTINLTPNTSYEIYDAPGIQGTSVSSGASPKVPLTIWYYTSS